MFMSIDNIHLSVQNTIINIENLKVLNAWVKQWKMNVFELKLFLFYELVGFCKSILDLGFL